MQAHGVWSAIESEDPKAVVQDRTYKIALAAIHQGVPEDVLLSVAEKKPPRRLGQPLKPGVGSRSRKDSKNSNS